jgi:DNA-binding transcriptional regulator PaaX
MKKVPSIQPFFKVNKNHVKELGASEAVLLAYVAEFEAHGLLCFASRKHISEQTGFAERTVQNLIGKLVAEGFLTVARDGHKRYLKTANKGGKNCHEEGKICLEEKAKIAAQRGQKMLNTKIDNTKIRNTKKSLQSIRQTLPPWDDDWNPFS